MTKLKMISVLAFAQDMLEGASCVGLNGLKYMEDEAQWNGKKEKKDTVQTSNSQQISKNY